MSSKKQHLANHNFSENHNDSSFEKNDIVMVNLNDDGSIDSFIGINGWIPAVYIESVYSNVCFSSEHVHKCYFYGPTHKTTRIVKRIRHVTVDDLRHPFFIQYLENIMSQL